MQSINLLKEFKKDTMTTRNKQQMPEYILKETRSGKPTLIVRKEKDTTLHSAYNPEKEAERAAGDFDAGRSSMILIAGLGLGYHVREIRKKYPDKELVIIEPDKEIVRICNKHTRGNITGSHIIRSVAEIPSVFEEIDMSGFRGIALYTHRTSHSLDPESYDRIITSIKQFISSKVSDLLTRFEFEERWIRNIFTNIHHIGNAVPVKDFFGKFKGYPGIIVSAGPSLKKNIQVLEKLRDSALIVCVDTAVKVLDRHGIEPHMVMTIDAQKYSQKHFLGLRKISPVLLADVVSLPSILNHYQGQKVISTTAKYYSDSSGNMKRESTPVMEWIGKNLTEPGDIQSGGSVATSAFDLLLNLGCNPIILTGQDLAYTGREIHCSGTYHNDDWLPQCSRIQNLDTINQKVIRKRSIKYIKAFGGKEEVISDFVFDLYRNWFNDAAQRVDIRVINATEGGAFIENTVEKSLREIAEKYRPGKTSPEEIIKKILSAKREVSFKDFSVKLNNILEKTEEIKQVCLSDPRSGENASGILENIENSELGELYMPYLRRTKTYMLRQNLSAEKTSEMILADIISASDKLGDNIRNCLSKIDE